MTEPRLDIVAIGNAIVDVIAQADDAFIANEGVAKGSMRLIDTETATGLYGRMGQAIEASGGSAANTVAGAAALGRRCGFIGQVAQDQLGEVFVHDIRALGVEFATPAREGEPPTARCLILVTPDGQRTMNTYLGASQFLPAEALDRDMIASAAILYLEGYLWDPAEPRAAMQTAIRIARDAGRKVAFTLSDAFCIERHRDDFKALIADGAIDILFANETEILSLNQTEDFEAAVAATAGQVETLVVTRSEKGAIAVRGGERFTVPAQPIDAVVDTTGAGDLFAAGFLAGQAEGRSVVDSLTMGAIAAAEVISHFGPRPVADIKALVARKLG
ncbi:PfkB protein [Sphingomonas sp. MM-1]|uniref:adenosine kinase n=1 Tax=Sphingomonas sp. MM-1 TaxID=745310 RepID=UPI0002C08DDB|nr:MULTISPECIES: adenosine kinase [unclassified Sphingomonas]AGH50016.1 PfkB protein [Sphingomonas sp. MM-1]MDX3883122.1 adenosine kinase [Sphingomonas sp.]